MRLRALPCLVAGVVAVLAASTAVAADAAATPAAVHTVLSMQADATMRDPSPDGGGAVVFRDSTVTTTVTSSGFDVAGFDPSTPSGGVDEASIGVRLVAGTTFTAGRTYAIGSDAGAGDDDVTSWSHLSCTVSTGSVSVLELVVDRAGAVTSFAADFSTSCADGSSDRGSVRVGSAVGFAGAVASPGVTGRGDEKVAVGDTRTTRITVTSAGTTPLTLGAAALDTTNTGTFAVGSDTCTGRTLAVGTSCTVDLAVRPLTAGVVSAVLRLPSPGLTRLEFGVEFAATDPDVGTYHRVTPERILDTRDGTGGYGQPVGPGRSVTLHVPTAARASAVVVNLTVTNPSAPGYVTAFPSGGVRPPTSSINFVPGQTVANLVTVPVSADGSFDLFNALGRTDLLVDLLGWYAADDFDAPRGGGYHPTLSERLLDTRTWAFGKLEPGGSAQIPVRYPDDGGHIAALAVNVTATDVEGVGYVSASDGYSGESTSTLNVTPGATVPNAAVVPATYCPRNLGCSDNAWIEVYNGTSGALDVVVDVTGFYDDGNLPATVRYRPLAAPTRVVDTRAGLGLTRFGPGQTQTFVPGTDVAGYDTWALDSNVTGIALDTSTYLTAWPGGYDDYPRPTTSVVNPGPGQIVANHAMTGVGNGNRVNYYNNAGRLDLVLDVSGTFELFPATPVDQQQGRARQTPTTYRRAQRPTARPVAVR